MPTQTPTYSIILAAGKGTRMKSPTMHKVCFPVDGVPAINRSLSIYNDCGIRHHLVVVGALAGQVIQTVGEAFDNVSFVYQHEQLGTAHATRVALPALEAGGGDREVLVVAGDRIIEPAVLEQLFDTYYAGDYDLALLATRRQGATSQGRLLLGQDGDLLAIVEDADIRQRQAYGRLANSLQNGVREPAELLATLRDTFTRGGAKDVSDSKFEKAFGSLWERLQQPDRITDEEAASLVPEPLTDFRFTERDGSVRSFSPDEVDQAALLNNSVYLVRHATLRHALDRLGRDNAQREEYLSEVVQLLSQARDDDGQPCFRCRALEVDDPRRLMGFNDPAELLEVETYIQAHKSSDQHPELPLGDWFRSIGDWQTVFDRLAQRDHQPDDPVWQEFTRLYGDEWEVLEERIDAYREILGKAADELGPERPVLIVRSPGRINVLSRHIDHQGGNCNLMTIGFETLMVVGTRQDDTIHLMHVQEDRFGEREFTIGQLVQQLPWEDWLSLVNSAEMQKHLHSYGGDWSQYITAAILRLQKKFKQKKLRGLDMVVSGNVPMAAGLSSSSSLVVGAADATIAANRLLTFPSQVVDLCGEGEWFVGTRGGAADHAAVKLGEKGSVIKVTFFPFSVEEAIPFPDDYVMAVCDSGIRAQKSANAKDLFNHRVSCYKLGFLLIKEAFPQFAPLLHHLRDVNVRTLGVPLSWIYRLLLHLPEQATRDELRAMLPDADLEPLFSAHQPPADGLYPIRGVVMFGLAECERARLYGDYLKEKRLADIGRLMCVSHDGDRVVRHDDQLQPTPYLAPTSNAHLLSLMDDLDSGDPDRVIRAQLHWQPGSYHCSHPDIDRMVDISLQADGVIGAQLAGAGLGGCMMVLARADATDSLVAALDEHYYAPRDRDPAVLFCTPVAGAGILMKNGS